MNDVGITVILAVIGIIITSILVVKNVKGNILWGILITWILGIVCQLTGLYVLLLKHQMHSQQMLSPLMFQELLLLLLLLHLPLMLL